MPTTKRGRRHARVRNAMEDRFDELDLVLMDAARLHVVLPTSEERAEFAAAFPARFYDLCWFNADESDTWPASITFNDAVFSRPDFPKWLAQQTPPKQPFDPPDTHRLPWCGVHELAQARCRWWLENRWPVTEAEREWVWKHAREVFPEARRCPDEAEPEPIFDGKGQ